MLKDYSMKTQRLFQLFFALACVLGGLALAGCPEYQFSEGTAGKEAVQRHYDAGDMSEAQYEVAMRSFDPKWQPGDPATGSGNVTSSGSDKPAAP